jgi:hypothetical protein
MGWRGAANRWRSSDQTSPRLARTPYEADRMRRFLKPMDDRRPRGCLHDLWTKARKFLKTGAHPYQPARSRRPRPAVGPRCAGVASQWLSQRSHSGLSQRPVPGTLNVKVSLSRPSTRSIPRSKGSCSHEDSQTRPQLCDVLNLAM